MQVPFLDLKSPYKLIEHKIAPVVTEAMGGFFPFVAKLKAS